MDDVSEPNRGLTCSQHDQVRLHFLRQFEDGSGSITVFHDTFRIAPVVGRLRNHSVERGLEAQIQKVLLCGGFRLISKHVTEVEIRAAILGKRKSIHRRLGRFFRKICGVNNILED